MNCGICHKKTDLWEDNFCEECADLPRYRYYSTLRPPTLKPRRRKPAPPISRSCPERLWME